MSKCRTYTPEFKAAVVLAVLSGTKTAAEVCREHRIKPSLLTRWKQQFLAQADQVFRGDQERQQAEIRIRELERMVGRLTLQLEMAKKSLAHAGLDQGRQRAMIEHLHQAHGYPAALLCDVVGLPRSTYYHHPTPPDDTALAKGILDILGTFPTYGTRRVTAQLQRAPYRMQVSRKRVQRVMRQKGWLQAVKKRKVRTTQSQHGYQRYPNLVKGMWVERPNQVWVSDITYIRLTQGFVYLAVIMDVFTRRLRGWALSRHLDQQLTLMALEWAMATHGPKIHHSDQGVQYAATAYVAVL